MLITHHSLQKAQSETLVHKTIILNSTCEKYVLQKKWLQGAEQTC